MVLQSNFLSNCYIPNFTYTVSFFNLKKKKKILPFPEYLRNFQNWSSCWPYSHNNWRSFGSYFGLKKLHKLSFWTPEAQSSKIWKKVQFWEVIPFPFFSQSRSKLLSKLFLKCFQIGLKWLPQRCLRNFKKNPKYGYLHYFSNFRAFCVSGYWL